MADQILCPYKTNISFYIFQLGVDIATGYRLDGPGSIPGSENFSLHGVRTDSGAHPDSYPIGTGSDIAGGKSARA
jgi:hypothetical protein